jgi:2-polyprenyl-3-methyl-5-hydroxy-6-metoxy-1,4-benzoquinol methylase
MAVVNGDYEVAKEMSSDISRIFIEQIHPSELESMIKFNSLRALCEPEEKWIISVWHKVKEDVMRFVTDLNQRLGGDCQSLSELISMLENIGMHKKTWPHYKGDLLKTEECHQKNNSVLLSISAGTVTELYEMYERQIIGCGLRQLKHHQRPFVFNEIIKYCGGDLEKGKFLEIGAGFDNSSGVFAEAYGPRITILDKYEGEWASRSGKTYEDLIRENFKVKYVIGLAGYPEEHKISDNSFECIYSVSVLEHVPKHKFGDVLLDIDRMLKPDGIQVHSIDFPVDRGNEPLQFYLNHFKKYLIAEDQGRIDGFNLDLIRSDPMTFYEAPEIYKLYWGNPQDRRDIEFERWASLNIVIKKLYSDRDSGSYEK